jgi:adenylate kinase family enzyme
MPISHLMHNHYRVNSFFLISLFLVHSNSNLYYVMQFSFEHISTGDLLRQHIQDKTPLGIKVADIMKTGALVSDEIVIALVLASTKSLSKNLLLDGFPRTVHQVSLLLHNQSITQTDR